MKYKKNYHVIYELAKANDKMNTSRNRILIGAVMLAVILLFCTFSIAQGKVAAESARNVREAGTAASAYLDFGSKIQCQDLKKLSYIDKVGFETSFASIFIGDDSVCECAVLDETGYQEMLLPACTDVYGSYPTKENEVMLSQRALEALDIKNPEVGMKIPMSMGWYDWMRNKEHMDMLDSTFVLSGYYTDYIEETQNLPVAYFSETFLRTNQYKGNSSRILIKLHESFSKGIEIEKRLYQNIKIENEHQQIVVNNSPQYEAVEEFIGGFGIAIFCSILIFVCAYLLIYNILSITMSLDIRQFGLLKSIGMTTNQLRIMLYFQSLKKAFTGCILGGLLGTGIVCGILPKLLEKLYLQGSGSVSIEKVFLPKILVFSILFVLITTFLATGRAIKKVSVLSATESVRYQEDNAKLIHKPKKVKLKRVKKSKEGSDIAHMAWRNLTRSKRKFVINLISLTLGCEVALGAVVISKGTDKINELRQNPDFEIGIETDAVDKYKEDKSFQDKDEYNLFSEKYIGEIARIAEISQEEIKICWGGYGFVEIDKKDAFRPKLHAMSGTRYIMIEATIQVVNEKYLKKLETYITENDLSIDMESLKNGTGILLLHHHRLSEHQEIEAKQVVGNTFTLYNTFSDLAEEKNGIEMKCSGYLDTKDKYFPKPDMTYYEESDNYFIATEAAFQKSGYQKQIFHISFDVKEQKEAEIKDKLRQWVENKNKESGEIKIFYLTANSEVIASEQNYLNASRMIMGTLSLVLIFMGIMNYSNTRITDFISRKKEFAVMESIGMTRKQLQKMLILESGYFVLCVMGCLMTIGSIALWLLGKVMKLNLLYFVFYYPFGCLCMIGVLLFGACILIPMIQFKTLVTKSAVERLRGDT